MQLCGSLTFDMQRQCKMKAVHLCPSGKIPVFTHNAKLQSHLLSLLRLSSSSSHWNIGWPDSSISDGQWRFSLHPSMLFRNLVHLLWMSYAESFVVFLLVSCHLLVSNSWLHFQVCLSTWPVSSYVLSVFHYIEQRFIPDLLITPRCLRGQSMIFPNIFQSQDAKNMPNRQPQNWLSTTSQPVTNLTS